MNQSLRIPRRRWGLLGLWFVMWFAAARQVDASGLRTIALSGQAAPGAGASFQFEHIDGYPVINDAGEVAFRAGLRTSQTGDIYPSIWRSGGPSGLQFIAKKGDVAPGATASSTFHSFRDPVLSDAGDLVLYSLRNGSQQTNGVWVNYANSTALQLIAEIGGVAPGTPSGVTFSHLDAGSPSTTNGTPRATIGGQTVFFGRLTGPNITSANNLGLWYADRNGNVELIVRKGDQVPGLAEGVKFGRFSAGGDTDVQIATINEHGVIAFLAEVEGLQVGDALDSLWRYDPLVGLSLVGIEDEPIPGEPGSKHAWFGPPVLNSQGDLAFYGSPKDGLIHYPLVVDRQGNGPLVAYHDGDAATGTGSTFSSIRMDGSNFATNPVVNAQGRIAFSGALVNHSGVVDSTNDSGIWKESAFGIIELVAQEGEQAPGTEPGATFFDFNTFMPSINAKGQVAFVNQLRPSTPGGTDNVGLWAEDLAGDLILIAREGGQLDVDDGPGVDLRTISTLRALGYGNSGNEDGRASGFNDRGQITFAAIFTDGSSGVFVSNVVASLPTLEGDFNDDDVVDAADYTVWRNHLGESDESNIHDNGDGGDIGSSDYALWKSHYGESLGGAAAGELSVPEPAGVVLLLIGGLCSAVRRRGFRRSFMPLYTKRRFTTTSGPHDGGKQSEECY